MDANGGLVLTPESAPSSEQGPDPEEDALAQAEFAALHGPALRASGVPERYWGRLLHKLEHEVRPGATRGEQGAGPGGPGAERSLGTSGVDRPGPLYREGCGLRAGPCPRTAGRPAWARLGKAGRPPGDHVPTRLGGCPGTRRVFESAFSRRLCAAGQASVRPTGVRPAESWWQPGWARQEKP